MWDFGHEKANNPVENRARNCFIVKEMRKNHGSLEYPTFGKMLSPYSTKLSVGLMQRNKQNNKKTVGHMNNKS